MLDNTEITLLGSIMKKLPFSQLTRILDELEEETQLELLDHWMPADTPSALTPEEIAADQAAHAKAQFGEYVEQTAKDKKECAKANAEKVVARRKTRIDVKPVEHEAKEINLTTLGKVSMDDYKRGLDLVKRFNNGEIKPKRLMHNKDCLLIVPHRKSRLFSKDRGETWLVMGAGTYSKKINQLSA